MSDRVTSDSDDGGQLQLTSSDGKLQVAVEGARQQ